MTEPGQAVPASALLDLLHAARARGTERFHLVAGQYAPSPSTAERWSAFAIDGEGLAPLGERWTHSDALRSAIRETCAGLDIRLGESDAMFATPIVYSWSSDGRALSLYRGTRRVLSAGRLAIDRRWKQPIPAEKIAAAEAWVSDSWLTRGVRLRFKTGKTMGVARRVEPMAALDPTYDGIDLFCDASWTIALARALAQHLQVAFEKDDAL